MPEATQPTREEIEQKRAEAAAKRKAEDAAAVARQDAIHKLAYKLHQDAMDNDKIKEKPGYGKALEEATKQIENDTAKAAAARAKTPAKTKGPTKTQTDGDATPAADDAPLETTAPVVEAAVPPTV